MWRFSSTLICVLLFYFVCLSCNSLQKTYNRAVVDRQISPDALTYFKTAFDQIERNTYYRSDIDFSTILHTAVAKIENARTYEDTYKGIEYVISELKDNHSFFRRPSKNLIQALSDTVGSIPFETAVLDEKYGFINLKSYNSIDMSDQHQIADSLYRTLKRLGTQDVKGLIIDFRVMEGGTALPFLCGFAPLINKDLLLGYVNNKGHKTQIVRYKNGIYHKDGRSTSRLSYLTEYADLSISSLPIAIITGKYTASSGEAILISFLGLPNVRTFGHPTFGVPTGKSSIFLADSAFISLTTSATYDRNLNIYDDPIHPDVLISDERDSTYAIRLAKAWIDAQIKK